MMMDLVKKCGRLRKMRDVVGAVRGSESLQNVCVHMPAWDAAQ